jgi:hypothetical protein
MIQIQSCRKSLALIFLLFVLINNSILAQFSIDTSAVPSGILWKQSRFMYRPPSSGDTIDYETGCQALKSLLNSRLSHDGSGITEVKKSWEGEDLEVNTVVLFPTALRYQYIDGCETAFFDSTQGNHYVPEAFTDSVYKSEIAFFVASSEATLRERVVRFVVSVMYQWSNLEGVWEVDFDDGQGWRLLNMGAPYVVSYDNVTNDRIIHFRFTSEEGTLFTSTKLKASSVTGCSLLPHSPPWMENENLPWRISTSFQGSEVAGNAYTLWSEDGVFDKPFVFVEGIDFNLQQWQGQIGDFGWCQFLGHDEVNYPMLAQSEEFVLDLRSRGYDLILLDFVDGAASIVYNAALLKRLIHLCNAYKEGNQSLVVAGASMGGQVARVALAEMERDSEKHCTGIYISWDSPHLGANIPLSIQATIDFLSPFSAEAEAFETEALNRPAAKEMLIYQHFSSNGQTLHPEEFENFQEYLQTLGMPKMTINWAIANGSGLGINLQNPIWTPLLETSCDASSIFSGDEFKMHLFAVPGNPEHPASTQDMSVIADLIYSETYSELLFFAYTEYSGTYSISNAAMPLDYKAGGFRTSVKELVDVVNDNEDYLSVCNEIGTEQYSLQHSFISTESALGYSGIQNVAILDALIQNAGSTPFDLFYIPSGQNQPHVAMTPQNIQWLLTQLDIVDFGQSTALNYNCNPYNYGSTGDDYLFPTTLYGIQEVSLNAETSFHCGTIESVQEPMKKMRLMADCAQIGFVLRDKTKLSIGDENGNYRCQLTLSPGSSIRLHDKSTVVLGYGSKLVVGNGSKVIIEDLSSLVNLGGEIIVLEGGEIQFNGKSMALAHHESKLILEEGILKIAQDKTLDLQPVAGSTGFVIVRSKNHPSICFGNGSMLVLSGDDRDDDVLQIESGCILSSLNDNQAGMRFSSGAIQFGHNARWLNGTLLKLGEIKLYSFGAYEDLQTDVVFQGNKILIEGCIWHHVSASGFKSDLRANATRWIGNENQHWTKGSLAVSYSDMLGVGWECDEVGKPLSFRSVTFSGNGNPFGIKAQGLSDSPLLVEECQFSDYKQGINQENGDLRVACSKFTQLKDGIDVAQNAVLLMGQSEGRNYFDQNDRHIVLNEVTAPDIQNGYNWFGSFGEYSVFGLLSLPTNSGVLDWSGNEWNGNEVYIQAYEQAEPNDIALAQIQFEPMLSDVSCQSIEANPKSIAGTIDLRGQGGDGLYHIYDSMGKMINHNQSRTQFEGWLAQAHLSSGVYLVVIQSKGRTFTNRLMIP